MSGQLQGQRVLLTGAGRGIGRVIAGVFAEEGARMSLIDLDEVQLRETAALLTGDLPHEVRVVDISDGAAVDVAVKGATEAMGGLDVVINNAGIREFRPFLQLDADLVRHHIDVNVLGTLNVMLAACQQMVPARAGRIINLTSIVAERPMANNAAYSASKAALRALSIVAAQELGRHGISVTCLAPGPTATELTAEALQDPHTRDRWVARMPLGRVGTPEDVASAAVYLAATAFTTGTTVYVDGGYLAT